jgi:hypothetical protein
MENAVAEILFGEQEFDEQHDERKLDAEYGKGKWPKAVITEVTPQAANDFGRSIIVKANLKGDTMPFTFFVDAPVNPGEGAEEKAQTIYQIQLNKLKSLVHGTGLWVKYNERGYANTTSWPKTFLDFSTDEAYDQLVQLLGSLTGSRIGLNVRYRTYTKKSGEEASRKDVWGLTANRDNLDESPF